MAEAMFICDGPAFGDAPRDLELGGGEFGDKYGDHASDTTRTRALPPPPPSGPPPGPPPSGPPRSETPQQTSPASRPEGGSRGEGGFGHGTILFTTDGDGHGTAYGWFGDRSRRVIETPIAFGRLIR